MSEELTKNIMAALPLRVYVGGPYSGDGIRLLDNMRAGIDLCIRVAEAGFSPYNPWLDYQYALMRDWPVETFYSISLSWLVCSQAMLLAPGWENSQGTKKELTFASLLGIPVFESMEKLCEWRDSLKLQRESDADLFSGTEPDSFTERLDPGKPRAERWEK